MTKFTHGTGKVDSAYAYYSVDASLNPADIKNHFSDVLFLSTETK